MLGITTRGPLIALISLPESRHSPSPVSQTSGREPGGAAPRVGRTAPWPAHLVRRRAASRWRSTRGRWGAPPVASTSPSRRSRPARLSPRGRLGHRLGALDQGAAALSGPLERRRSARRRSPRIALTQPRAPPGPGPPATPYSHKRSPPVPRDAGTGWRGHTAARVWDPPARN